MAFLQGSDRLQMRMSSLEDMIDNDHPVRFLEAFVEKLELFLVKGFYVQKAHNKCTKPRISIGQFVNHKKTSTKPPRGDSPQGCQPTPANKKSLKLQYRSLRLFL